MWRRKNARAEGEPFSVDCHELTMTAEMPFNLDNIDDYVRMSDETD